MQWVASTLHTTSERGVSSITTADAHTSAASSRLNLRPLAYLNGLVRLAERLNLVSARVPSHFKRSLRANVIPVAPARTVGPWLVAIFTKLPNASQTPPTEFHPRGIQCLRKVVTELYLHR